MLNFCSFSVNYNSASQPLAVKRGTNACCYLQNVWLWASACPWRLSVVLIHVVICRMSGCERGVCHVPPTCPAQQNYSTAKLLSNENHLWSELSVHHLFLKSGTIIRQLALECEIHLGLVLESYEMHVWDRKGTGIFRKFKERDVKI